MIYFIVNVVVYLIGIVLAIVGLGRSSNKLMVPGILFIIAGLGMALANIVGF